MRKSFITKIAFLLFALTLSVGIISCERIGGGPSGDSNTQPVSLPDPI